MQDRFTSNEVIALTGITPRQLQWWDERGVVKPEREGHRRLYSMNHLTEVAVICELRRKGISLQGIRRVMRFLEREIGNSGIVDVTIADDQIAIGEQGCTDRRIELTARSNHASQILLRSAE